NLPSGRYVVQAIGGERQSDLSAPVDVAAGKPVTVNLTLTSGRPPAPAPARPRRLPGEQVGGGGGGPAPPPPPQGAGETGIESKMRRVPRHAAYPPRAREPRALAGDPQQHAHVRAGLDGGKAADGRGSENRFRIHARELLRVERRRPAEARREQPPAAR